MAKEPGEPQIALCLTPDGVSITIQALLKGDGSDWHQDVLGSWILSVWEKVRTVAQVNAEYGLIPSSLPSQQAAPAPPLVSVKPTREEEKERLEGLIEKSIENGHLLPVSKRLPLEIWKRKALEMLRSSGGTLSSNLRAIDPTLNRNTVQQRLYDLRDCGLAEFRHTTGAPTHGLWHATEPNSEASVDVITSVLPFSRGKTFLMLGGRPKVESKRDLEHQLSLAELRWPELEESDPIEWYLREIRKEDIDLVIVNRFNRKRSSQFMHVAQEEGKPYLYLMRGYGVYTVAFELKKQVLDGGPELRVAA